MLQSSMLILAFSILSIEVIYAIEQNYIKVKNATSRQSVNLFTAVNQ